MNAMHHTVCRRVSLVLLAAILFASGCSSGPAVPLPLISPNLNAYLTATRVTPLVPTLPASSVPVPSATPSTYKVAPGDTLSGIAQHFAIRLDDLLAANPGVVPDALSVGQTLKIPASSSGAAGSSGPTPVPAEIGSVRCYPSGGGQYCLALVHNPLAVTLENVKLQISLLDAGGHSLAGQEAFLPLDILPSGSSLPAYAFFPSQAAGLQPMATLVTSIRLKGGDARYLSMVDQNVLISVDWNGRSAQVQGQLLLGAGNSPARSIWLAGVAYDKNGQVIGFRRWEWQGHLQPGDAQPFAFTVYSLGPVIDQVQVTVEAKP